MLGIDRKAVAVLRHRLPVRVYELQAQILRRRSFCRCCVELQRAFALNRRRAGDLDQR